jgi:hypothetical protein
MANARWRVVAIVLAGCVCSSAATVTATGTWAATGAIVPGISEHGASWSMSFDMDPEPVPLSSNQSEFDARFWDFEYSLAGSIVAIPATRMTFYTSARGGLLRTYFGSVYIDLLGPQIFTGSPADPVMLTGIYSITSGNTSTFHPLAPGGQVTVTPEPSTFGIGGAALALVAFLRRRARA